MINLDTTAKCLINLQTRKDRLIKATNEINTFFDNKAVKLINGVIDSTPLIGIAKAHLNAIKYGYDNDLDNIIILEDDIIFRPGAKKYAINCFNNLPNNYDILLGGLYQSNGLKPYNEYWSKTETFCGLHFYVVNKQAYKKILDNYNFKNHIDRYMAGVGKLDCYVVNKFFAVQSNGYSDNSKQNCNYDYMLNDFNLL